MLFHRKTIFITQFLSQVYQISFGAHCIRFGVSLQHVRSYMNVQARACNYQCQRQKFYAQNSRQLYTCARSNGLFSRKLTPTSFILAAAPAASKLSHSDVGLQADLIITYRKKITTQTTLFSLLNISRHNKITILANQINQLKMLDRSAISCQNTISSQFSGKGCKKQSCFFPEGCW